MLLDEGKLFMVFSHIYGNVVTVRPDAAGTSLTARRRQARPPVDFGALYAVIESVGIQDVVALSPGLLAFSGESQLVDCTVHHNRVELVGDPQKGNIRQQKLDEGPHRLFAFVGGAVFKRGVHRMQRCSVYENATPDPET